MHLGPRQQSRGAAHGLGATTRPARVVLVLSDRPDAGGLAARGASGIPGGAPDPSDAAEWLGLLDARGSDLLVLAGYLKLVPAAVVASYRGRIINMHPALLPAFGGPGMYGPGARGGAGERRARERRTVHLVDEEYDRGADPGPARVPVLPGDTPDTLAARVLDGRASAAAGGGAGRGTRRPAGAASRHREQSTR